MKKISTSLIMAAAAAFSANNLTAAERMLIIGDATPDGWSHDKALMMLPSAENPDIFTFTGTLKADTDFKFTTATEWIDDMEYRNPNEDPYQIDKLRAGGNDTKFRVSQECNYLVICDLQQLTVTVKKAEYQDNPIRYNALYLIGDATDAGWNLPNAVELTQDTTDPFLFKGTADLKAQGSFKIATNPNVGYGQTFFHPEPDNNGKLTNDGTDDRQWRVADDGKYNLTAHLLNHTIDIEKAPSGTINSIDENEVSGTDCDPVYYNLQGVRVANPVSGLYIKVTGSKATKIRL